MARIKWSEKKIEEYVSKGWSLSYDKTNDRFKLQKRVNGKVKSYSLPRQFNDYCRKLKEELELTHGVPLKKIYERIEDERKNFVDLESEYHLEPDDLEKIFEKYCEEKVKELTPEQVAKMALYSYLFIKKTGGLWKRNWGRRGVLGRNQSVVEGTMWFRVLRW